uniref:Ig-like domain-containing protein n=1 Tax=Myripristis murdjan TaxID=586833 RepID=A0A667ZHY8_9TELE
MQVYFFHSTSGAQYSDISQPVSFQTVELGHPVTIECQIKSALRTRVWYKLTAGRKLQCVVSVDTFYNRNVFASQFQQLDHHFSVTNDGIKTDLNISAATWEDIGTYYCGVVHLNFIEFGPGTFLMLRGAAESLLFSSHSLNHSRPGDSVNLSCSIHTGDCGGEDTSVFWLKNSESFGPEMIYIYGNKSESCERIETGSPETSCVFKLPKQNLSSDDAGTYYCVVASCGETLFGNGTNLNLKSSAEAPSLDPAVTALVLCNIVLGMATLLLVWALCKSRNKDPTVQTDGSSRGNQASYDVTYAAVSLGPRGPPPRTTTVDHNRDGILYSEVSHCQLDWEV